MALRHPRHTPRRTPRHHRTARRAVLGGLGATALTVGAVTSGALLPGAAAAEWPEASGEQRVTETIEVSDTFDGGMVRFVPDGLGDGGQDEEQDPVFRLADGATLENVIIGAPGADGVHCEGSCTLRNVWWEDVGEDAATFRGGDDARYTVVGGGARHANDKVLQHNGGGTLTVSGFAVEDFGALYRSCGNCTTQHQRHVVLENVEVTAPGDRIVGVNTNYGDTATLRNITLVGDGDRQITICRKYLGNDRGEEPVEIGEGPDDTHCLYTESDLTYR